MDVLVFMAVVFGGLYVYDAIKTHSVKKAAHMIFDLGDENNGIK
jgi:cbb3-type cytochrome oxidase subunit 3